MFNLKNILLILISLYYLLIIVSTTIIDYHNNAQPSNSSLQGVILTIGKDTRVFEKSIISSLKYLIDIDKFYIITPNANQLKTKLHNLGSRVIFIDESIFPFNWKNVSEIMIESVRQKGVYPLNDKSQFEHTVWGRSGWFLQQLLKFYAGKILNLGDFVLLDSDIVWFKNISFVNQTNNGVTTYNYASSNQYHAAYVSTLKQISGIPLYKGKDTHRSGRKISI